MFLPTIPVWKYDALNGLPGVHSARFAGENKDSSANIEKVLINAWTDRKQESQVQNCNCSDL